MRLHTDAVSPSLHRVHRHLRRVDVVAVPTAVLPDAGADAAGRPHVVGAGGEAVALSTTMRRRHRRRHHVHLCPLLALAVATDRRRTTCVVTATNRNYIEQEAQLMLTTRSTLTRPCRISDGLTAHTTLTKAIK